MTPTTSVACWTNARNRASLSASTSRARSVSDTSLAMRQATSAAVTPTIAVSATRFAAPGVVEDDDRGRREQRGAEHDHARASVADEPGVARVPRASRIDGCSTAAASRKYAIGQSASSALPSV